MRRTVTTAVASSLAVLVLTAAASLLAAGATRAAADPPTVKATDGEGLQRVRVQGLQSVYALPGARLADYSRVMLDPIEVAFRKDWDPRPGGWPVSAAERQRIRAELATLLRGEFVREIQNRGNYTVVGEPDENVLRVRAEIRDLYINAPDVDRPGRVTQYTLSTGEMTLVAELRDSVSGELIARVIDRRKDPEKLQLERTTRIDNAEAARAAGRRWAEILHAQLDRARALMPPPAGR